MSLTRTVVAIASFNVVCCILFFILKLLLFYDVIEMKNYKRGGDWIVVYKSNAFYDVGIAMIFEMTGYFLGIYANAMLLLGVNTARYKDEFCFFRFYYIASIWLSAVLMIEAVRLEFWIYAAYSILNFIFIFLVTVVQMKIHEEISDKNKIIASVY